jgi:hypothetical protein
MLSKNKIKELMESLDEAAIMMLEAKEDEEYIKLQAQCTALVEVLEADCSRPKCVPQHIFDRIKRKENNDDNS